VGRRVSGEIYVGRGRVLLGEGSETVPRRRRTAMHVIPGALWMCLGVVVGILSGFLGVGGGIVLTPLFLYLGYSPKVATATALAFVIPTAWASIMKGHEHVDVPLAVWLAVGAVVGAYAIGQPLVQSSYLDPRLYKKLFGLLLLVVGLDMVAGFTDALRQRQAARATPVERMAGLASLAHSPAASDDFCLASGDQRRANHLGCWGATEHKTGFSQASDPKVPNHIPL
jgi:hypothetical protein